MHGKRLGERGRDRYGDGAEEVAGGEVGVALIHGRSRVVVRRRRPSAAAHGRDASPESGFWIEDFW